MIKLENDNVIISFYDKVNPKYSEHVDDSDPDSLHKIDLTNGLFYFYTDNETTVDMEWEEDFVNSEVEKAYSEIKSRIINNKNVLFSSKQSNNQKEIDKTTRHLKNNITIQDFLNDYIKEHDISVEILSTHTL